MIDMVQAVLDMKAKSIKRMPCHSNRASSLGYFVPELEGCLRRGVYERTRWQEKELHSAETQLIFDEGNSQEVLVLRDLAAAGVQVIEQQTMYEWKEHQISGHIDGKIIDNGEAIPLEIKSMNPNIFATMKTFEDMKRKPWTRAYMAQVMMYMLMQNVDRAVFVLKDKSNGSLRQIEVGLDYDLGEYCIRTAEAINEHVRADTLPDRITDRETCKRCPYKMVCLPDIDFGVPLKIVDDPEAEERITRTQELKEDSAEYTKLWKLVSSEAKAQAAGGELNILCGKWHLTGKTDTAGKFKLKVEDVA